MKRSARKLAFPVRRRLAIAVLTFAVAAGACAQTEPSVGHIAIVGDSITKASNGALRAALEPTYNVDVAAANGKRIDQMLPALQRELGRDHPVAVIENLGTNDAIGSGRRADWQASWAQMIAMTANVPCVVLTTINTVTDTSYGHGTVAGDINTLIAALATSDRTKYKVVDWNGFLRRQGYPSGLRYIRLDVIHPTADGSKWLAARYKSALDRCRLDHRAPR
jgi:hypothetical protein